MLDSMFKGASGILIYIAFLVLGSRSRLKRESGKVPCMRYFGATFVMGLWTFLWLDLCVVHRSTYPSDSWVKFWDPLYGYPNNWQIPLVMGVLSFFGAILFRTWNISLDQDRIVIRRWPMRTKFLELSKLMGLERHPNGTGTILYFKNEPEFKINAYMSGYVYFLDSLEEYLKKRGNTFKRAASDAGEIKNQ